MYESYFGLTRKPFDLSPDPTIVYSNEMYQEALAILRYGIADKKGFLLLTGNAGTGKTTLLQILVNSINHNIRVCFIANPKISINDFYYHIAHEFGLDEFDGNKSKFLIQFTELIKECRHQNERLILIIDEAQVLPVDVIEEIRLLSNQEYLDHGILSVFLIGQPELNERLADERLLPLRQRIGIKFHLTPLSLRNTIDYISYRLQKSGSKQTDLFTTVAIQLIHTETKGIPRLINSICDQALLYAFSESRHQIDAKTIQQVIQSLALPGEQKAKPAQNKVAPKKKKKAPIRTQIKTKRSSWKIIVITIGLTLLVIAASYIFLNQRNF